MTIDWKLQKLLYICNYPPCDLGGACIIMKQVFSRYDQSKLHILCDDSWLAAARGRPGNGGLLECSHQSVATYLKYDLRPRRFFSKVRSLLNSLRSREIFRRAQKIVESEKIEALMIPLYDVEFAAAGYRLHKMYGIPFHVWECDEWEGISASVPYVKSLVTKLHPILLRDSATAWMTSPGMIRANKQRFGVDGKFLFNFVDVDKFARVNPEDSSEGPWKVIYTGAINGMFDECLLRIASWINQGISVDGREVELAIYTNCDTRAYTGKHVKDMGFVPHHQMPDILSRGDALLVAVSFAGSSEIMRMTKTSLYTKTIEYLAAAKPIIYVGPSDTAEHDYFGDVLKNVLTADKESFVSALSSVLGDVKSRRALVARGRSFVETRHSYAALDQDILSAFRKV